MGISFSHRSAARGPIVSESKSRALGVATNDSIPSDASIDAGTAKVVSPKPALPTKKLSSTSGGGGSGSSMGNMQLGATALNIDLDPLMTGFAYNTSDLHLYDIYRDMYFFDPVPGGIVDLFSTLPFSPYTFGGAKDAILEPFYEVNERLKIGSLLPRFAVDHLVTGTHVSSLIFDQKKKQFLDLMTYRMDNITATPIPFLSEDPILELRVPEDLRQALDHPSQRITKLKERFGAEFIEKFSNDTVELDQLGTIYFPRKSFSYEEGTSYFRRILPLWLIEKNLYRGTLIESGRRQRGILQIQMGDGGEWEPSVEEMEFMTDLVLAADADPIGSVITTRLGVNMSEFRSGGDLWKVTDIWDQTSQMKMKALGVSESFLSDTTYDNQNTGLNVFMEYMRSFRDQMTRQIFYEKIFPIVSMMHGYTVNRNGKVVISNMIKGDYHEIMNRMRDGSRIFIPQVHWAKQMHPEVNQSALDSLRAMQELGIPPALRAVAAAGGFNLDQLLADADENIAIERRVMEYKKRMGDLRKRYGLGDEQESSMSANSKSMIEALSGVLPKSGVLGNMAMPKLRTRNFDPEIVGTSRTGKKKYIHNQSQANDKANKNIMKAMEALSRSRNNPLTNGSSTSFSATEMDISNLRRF